MSALKTCSTCKHWERIGTHSTTGICDRVDGWKSDIIFDVVATASDDTGLESHLETGHNFGCILHEDKRKSK